MSVRLFITIDTEEDLWNNYQRESNPCQNIQILPDLQKIFEHFDAIPTYLINYAVATDKCAREILTKIVNSGRCEIGTHCHPWNTPPFIEELTPYNTMLENLSLELQAEKIRNLHYAIKKTLGIEPATFRAGRWGFGQKTARSLYQLGYKIDSSVTPFTDWRRLHGPDFSTAPVCPHYINIDSEAASGQSARMLEIPVTVGFLQPYMYLCGLITRTLRRNTLKKLRILSVLNRLNIVSYRWLSPENSSATDMIKLAKMFIKQRHCHLNMTFHSTSLLPGKSPFVSNMKELTEFYSRIERFLEFAAGNGLVFSRLADAQSIQNIKA